MKVSFIILYLVSLWTPQGVLEYSCHLINEIIMFRMTNISHNHNYFFIRI